VNTDDPAFIDLDLATEYARVADAYGWGWAEMVGLALDAVDASWLGDDEKVRLRADVASVARQHDVSEGGGLRHRG
jgi:adenosine deaminase